MYICGYYDRLISNGKFEKYMLMPIDYWGNLANALLKLNVSYLRRTVLTYTVDHYGIQLDLLRL